MTNIKQAILKTSAGKLDVTCCVVLCLYLSLDDGKKPATFSKFFSCIEQSKA
ncbi:MAG: hypothetical protein V4528_03955 [Pseudomonadota bacterium]